MHEAKEAILPDVVGWLANQPRKIEVEALSIIDSSIDPERRRRRHSLKTQLDYVLDAALSEDGAYVDPLLDLAYGLGTHEGLDRELRFWTVADLEGVVLTAYRKAAEATQAASALDQTVEKLVGEMSVRRISNLGGFAA
jgi:hypothetical protein